MSSLFSAKKILLFGFIFVLLFVIPLTIYLLQKQQEVRSRANPATTLSFVPSTQTVNVGQKAVFDIYLDPGTNQVSFAKLTISYDDKKLTADNNSLVPNKNTPNKLFNVLEGPVNIPSEPSVPATTSITLSVGADPTAVLTAKTKIATLSLTAKDTTDTNGTTIQFLTSQTQILSIGTSDQSNENVLLVSSLSPATVVIGGTSTSITPTATPTPSATTSSGTNPSLVCSSLTLDRSSTGTAPYAIVFTANGNNTNGTISKVSFNFGDGTTQDVTNGGGIGAASVQVQIAHNYKNPGTFTAAAVLTDNNGAVSNPSTCQQVITAKTAGGAGGQAGGAPIGAATPSAGVIPTVIAQSPTPIPSLAPTGPSGKLIGAGLVGAILSIVGGFLLFSL